MDRIMYIDPWAGAAGDMFVAALADVLARLNASDEGPDPGGILSGMVETLGLGDVEVQLVEDREGGFACRRLQVFERAPTVLRTLGDLEAVVGGADLPAAVAARARAALRRLASVEAGLHGVGVDEVHFHELGAVDTLVDVVGTLMLVHHLGIATAAHGPVPVGAGQVDTSHGTLAVPAPAALALLRGRPVFGGREVGEMTTPTGALLLTELASTWGPLPAMQVEAVGYGAGTRSLEHGPNILRLVVGRPVDLGEGAVGIGRLGEEPGPDRVVELRTTIDDASPEVLGHLHEALLRHRVLETWWVPVFMKKGRPGVELVVLCRAADEPGVVELVLRESTAFGIRRTPVARHRLERTWLEVEVAGVPVEVKVGRLEGRVMSVSPEFESARAAAERVGLPLKDVMRDAAAAAARVLEASD